MGRPRMRYFLSDLLLVLAISLFGLSMFQPLMALVDVTPPDFNMLRVVSFLRADFYTFKVGYYIEKFEVYSQSFGAYWFGHACLEHSNINFNSYFAIVTFGFQILTPILCIITFSLETRMRAISFVSAVATTVLATLLYFSLDSSSIFVNPWLRLSGPKFKWYLTAGYWLTCLSTICAGLSIMLSRGRHATPSRQL